MSLRDNIDQVLDAWTQNVSTGAEYAQVQVENLRIRQMEAAANIEQKRELMRVANKAVIFLAIIAAIAILGRFLKK